MDLSFTARGRKTLTGLVVLFAVAVAARTARATDYYVATTGSDSNAGTMAAPFATLQKGVNVAVAGDTVYIRAGTYAITTPATAGAGVQFTKSGTSDTNRIRYWAYPGEVPVFDFTNMVISTTGYTHGFVVTGSWLHFKGLEIAHVPMNTFSNNGVAVSNGGNCIFELLNMHHNSGNGIFIGKGTGGHLVLNCDAHDNYDATSSQGQEQNADGFGVHYQTAGATTIVRGCRAWWNSDDGYDLINQEFPVTVENSWAMGNGFAMYGTFNPADGNSNRFKMGSSATGVRHLVQNNVAWKNKASGFYANHSTGGNTWYNNTSFMNGTQYNMLASPSRRSQHDNHADGRAGAHHAQQHRLPERERQHDRRGHDVQHLGYRPSHRPRPDFRSTSRITASPAPASPSNRPGALGPRAADGEHACHRLSQARRRQPHDRQRHQRGSARFVGAAPDIGAYEFGAPTTTGGGWRAGGGGGTAGAGGATGPGSTGGMRSGTGGVDRNGEASGGTGGTSGGTSGANGRDRRRQCGRWIGRGASAQAARRAAARARSTIPANAVRSAWRQQRWAR